MEKGCLVLFILLVLCFSVYADEITKAVPVNIKTRCEEKFIGEPFCENNAVHQMYQNGVCYKYDKIIKSCSSEEICENGACISKRSAGRAVTGEAVKNIETDVETKGIISRIIDWIKSLF